MAKTDETDDLGQAWQPSAEAAHGPDHRRTPRRRVLLSAIVAYPDLNISYRCAIRDRSASGVRLRLPDGMVAPPRFWLIEVAEGAAYEATAAWRSYPEVGATLGAPIDLRAGGGDLRWRQLRALWLSAAPNG